MKTGIELIAEERTRQVKIGFSPEHDDHHSDGSLASAAAVYADAVPPLLSGADAEAVRDQILNHSGCGEGPWPWEPEWLKVTDDPVRNLVKAGALIAAEIDRLQRLQKR